MMAMQARQMFKPFRNHNDVLRSYTPDSPRAKARLIVLAMLADGQLAEAELEYLTRHGTFAKLGIAREDFFQVLSDFCEDAANLPRASRDYLFHEGVLEQLFREVDRPHERQALLRMIFDLIRSDGDLSDNEANLFWQAIDSWKFGPEDTRRALSTRFAHGAAG